MITGLFAILALIGLIIIRVGWFCYEGVYSPDKSMKRNGVLSMAAGAIVTTASVIAMLVI